MPDLSTKLPKLNSPTHVECSGEIWWKAVLRCVSHVFRKRIQRKWTNKQSCLLQWQWILQTCLQYVERSTHFHEKPTGSFARCHSRRHEAGEMNDVEFGTSRTSPRQLNSVKDDVLSGYYQRKDIALRGKIVQMSYLNCSYFNRQCSNRNLVFVLDKLTDKSWFFPCYSTTVHLMFFWAMLLPLLTCGIGLFFRFGRGLPCSSLQKNPLLRMTFMSLHIWIDLLQSSFRPANCCNQWCYRELHRTIHVFRIWTVEKISLEPDFWTK